MKKSLAIVLSIAVSSCGSSPSVLPTACGIADPVQALRFETNPLLDINSDSRLGHNINGPSVIKVPDWLPDPLGAYYMYFADHGGDHIKLAYANDPKGPWRLYEPGTLRMDQAPVFRGHIASPDIHIDEESRRIRMYFHGVSRVDRKQRTGLAFSANGIDFDVLPDLQGLFYFRVFQHDGWYYALAKNWNQGFMAIYRGKTGISDWEFGGNFLPRGRHAAVDLEGNTLVIYYSRVGDAPERIVRSTVDLSGDWKDWEPSKAEDVLSPSFDYEGGNHPVRASRHGSATNVAQLRDPAIFNEGGRKFLYYSGEGEETISGAEIVCKGARAGRGTPTIS